MWRGQGYMTYFYPRRAGNIRRRVSVCVSVCLSVKRRYCIKTAKHRITQTTPLDSPGTLLTPTVVGGRPPCPWNLCSQWTTPFQTPRFRPISAHGASAVGAGENSSLSTNRKSTTRFPTSHRWTVYVAPKSHKWWHTTLLLPVKFNCYPLMVVVRVTWPIFTRTTLC